MLSTKKIIAPFTILIILTSIFLLLFFTSSKHIKSYTQAEKAIVDIKINFENLLKFQDYQLANETHEDFSIVVLKETESLKTKINNFEDIVYNKRIKNDAKNIFKQIQEHNSVINTLFISINKNELEKISEHKTKLVIINQNIENDINSLSSNFHTNNKLHKLIQTILVLVFTILLLATCFYLFYSLKKQHITPINKIISEFEKGIDNKFIDKFELPKIENNERMNSLVEKINITITAIKKDVVKNKKETERFKNQFEYLQFSNEIGKFILSKLTVEKIIIDVYNELGIIFPMNTFSIGLLEKEKGLLRVWKINAINNRIQRFTENLETDESMSLLSLKSSKEIFIKDFNKEHKKYRIKTSSSISLNKSMIYLPLVSLTDRTIGVLSVKAKKRNTYHDYHLEIFRNLAIYIVTALENSKVYKQLEDQKIEISERNEELNQQREEIININENITVQKEKLENALKDIELLSKIGQDITAKIDISEITNIVHQNLEKLIDATYFGIGIYDGVSELKFKNVIERKHVLSEITISINEHHSVAAYCFNNFKEILINDIEKDYKQYIKKLPYPIHGEMTNSLIYLPLASKGEKLGVLTVQSYKKNAYTEHDLFILKSLASYVSIALSNANAFEVIEKNQSEIQMLANELEKQFGELQKSEDKMTNIINFVPDPLMVLDNNGKLVVWNKSMEKLTGILSKDILGVKNYEYSLAFYDERRPMLADLLLKPTEKFEEQYSSINESEGAISGQAYVPKLNKYLWGSAGLLYDSQGNILGVIQVSKDITKRVAQNDKIKEANKLLSKQKDEIEIQKEEILTKQVELHEIVEELKVTNNIIEDKNKDLERLSLVASKTDNAVIIMDNQANITWVNKSFTDFYGYSKNQFTNHRGRNWLDASYNPDIINIMRKTVETKKSSVYISKIKKSAFTTKWVQTTFTPIYDEQKILKNFIAVQTDISETKEAEKEIATQNKKIRHSIKYARRIQSAVLPQKRFIERTLAEHFILYKPRDIVSGDFYWIARKKTKILITAADCTGHGVPGAFMSMLGISYLNEIANNIFEKNGTNGLQAGKILNQLRNEVIKSLHQKRNTETKDGIDLALCVFDLDTQKMQYAGANNPLYVIRKRNKPKLEIDDIDLRLTENEEAILYEIKADKKPIGIGRNYTEKFRNKEFRVQKGDCVYMFSDGYIDQFGGNKGRKYLSANFRKLLLKIYQKPMQEQHRILDSTIKDWMNYPQANGKSYSQIDDILVVGLRF